MTRPIVTTLSLDPGIDIIPLMMTGVIIDI